MKEEIIGVGALIGLIVAGVVGYLMTMSYISNQTMDYVHQQVERLNAGHYLHAEFVSESRGWFYSTAELTLARRGDNAPLHVHVSVYSGLFSTTIMAAESSLNLPNVTLPLQQLNENISSAFGHITFNNLALVSGDFKGEGYLDIGTSLKLAYPKFHLRYTEDGRFSLAASISNYKEKGSNGRYLGIDNADLSLVYDAATSERILRAGRAYIESGSDDTYLALSHELLNHLPDVRLAMKEVVAQPSLRASEYSAHQLVVDIAPDTSANAPTRIGGTITGLGYSIYRRDITWDMTLDGSVADTLLTLLREKNAEQVKPRLMALAKTSPRLMIKELRATAEHTEPTVASGEIRFDGQTIASSSEIGFENVVADLTVTGLSTETIAQAQTNGIRSLKSGQAAKVTVSAGHLYVNGQAVF